MITTIQDIVAGFLHFEKTAMIYKTGFRSFSRTYVELHQQVMQCCNYFSSLGLQKGDKLLIWGFNSPYWCISYLAAAYMGIVIVPIDYLAKPEFVAQIQKIVKAKAICHSELKIPPKLNIPSVLLDYLDVTLEKVSSNSFTPDDVASDDLLEIVFTSGTTGDPKGVLLTHGNVTTNINSVRKQFKLYPEQTFLSLLPLSHLFEQNPGFLLPLHVGCTIVHIRGLRPELMFKALGEERITNIMIVPRLLQLFKDSIMREVIASGKEKVFTKMLKANLPIPLKRILFSKVHKKFGKHFQNFVAGGSALSEELQEFWEGMGFTIVQGYGLTECAPVLCANTFDVQVPGSVGKPLPDVEIKLSDAGEILARGANITTGYYKDQEKSKQLFEDGWMKTGDLAKIVDGNVFIHGRSKDVIVTGAGVNVHPTDIEQVIVADKNVKDACVVGLKKNTGEEVHAEIILADADADVKTIISAANDDLNDAQQITSFSLWEEDDFPRTTTMKIKKKLVLEAIQKRSKKDTSEKIRGSLPAYLQKLYDVIARVAKLTPEEIVPESKLAIDLNMTSVHRIELVSVLEQEFNLDIDETDILPSTTVKDLEEIIAKRKKVKRKNIFHRWLLSYPAGLIRIFWGLLIQDNLLRIFCWSKVEGVHNLRDLKGPAIFIANHVGHFDAPLIIKSLPLRIRFRLATAAWKEYFEVPGWNIPLKLLKMFYFGYASLMVNVFPFPKESGFKQSLEYLGELLNNNWNVLFFPEGWHSPTGELLPFKTGIGIVVKEMRVPIVPIKHWGLDNIMAGEHHQLPRFGKAKLKFGKPITIDPSKSIPEITQELQTLIAEMK